MVIDNVGAERVAKKGDTGTVMQYHYCPWVMMDKENNEWCSCNWLDIPKNRGEVFHQDSLELITEAVPSIAPDTIDGLKKERDEAINHLRHLTENWSAETGTITPFAEDVDNAVNFLAKYPKG